MSITLLIIVLIAAAVIIYVIKHISRAVKKEPAYENYRSPAFENKFQVIEIIDGDTFKVNPGWKWNGKKGYKIRPLGYDTPEKGEPGFDKATVKLKELLLNQAVELKNPIKLSYDRLLCDVYFHNKKLADFFPEYFVQREDEPGARDV